MSLVPGAVNGNDFFSTGGDDINYRVDGTDASGIRDQNMKVYTRLTMSQDAVAEFKVSAGLFSAETGGTPGAQVEIVTKSGSNEFHGTAFEYLRNAIFDSRTPFDPATHPPFKLNQFGATLGGADHQEQNVLLRLLRGLSAARGRVVDRICSDAVVARSSGGHIARSGAVHQRLTPCLTMALLSSKSASGPARPRKRRMRMSERCAWTTDSPTS